MIMVAQQKLRNAESLQSTLHQLPSPPTNGLKCFFVTLIDWTIEARATPPVPAQSIWDTNCSLSTYKTNTTQPREPYLIFNMPLRLIPGADLPEFTFSPPPFHLAHEEDEVVVDQDESKPPKPPGDLLQERDMPLLGSMPLAGRMEAGRALVKCDSCSRIVMEHAWAEHHRESVLDGEMIGTPEMRLVTVATYPYPPHGAKTIFSLIIPTSTVD